MQDDFVYLDEQGGRSHCDLTGSVPVDARAPYVEGVQKPRDTPPTAPSDPRGVGGDSTVSPAATPELCEVCGAPALIWRSCKLVCTNCRSIVKSCADL
jgi:hypothetical protein